jgi:xanthine dehydrogenase YagT iron-sulfur-binding subunit
MPSAVTAAALANGRPELPQLSDAEIRERMAGNICRCGAYPNIIAALRDVSEQGTEGQRS